MFMGGGGVSWGRYRGFSGGRDIEVFLGGR